MVAHQVRQPKPPSWLALAALFAALAILGLFAVLSMWIAHSSVAIVKAFEFMLAPALLLVPILSDAGWAKAAIIAAVVISEFVYFWLLLSAIWWVVATSKGRRSV